MRTWQLLGFLALLAAPAIAGDKEYKAAEKAWSAARSELEGFRGQDKAERDKKLSAVRTGAEKLAAEDPARAVEPLVEAMASSHREVGEAARAVLGALVLPKAVKAFADAWEKAEARERLLLVPALARCPGEPATKTLVEGLRDKSPAIRAECARALGGRGADARPLAEAGLRRQLKDDALSVRLAAARALESLGVQRPDGFPEPKTGEDGLPDRMWSDRVAILVDANLAGGEVAFLDPFAAVTSETPPGDKPGRDANKPGKPPAKAAPPPLFSPHALAVRSAGQLLERLPRETELLAARWATDFRSWKEAGRVDTRARPELVAWLAKEPRERGRDPLGALRRALAGEDPPEEVVLFLSGLPEGRGALAGEALLSGLLDLLWGRRVLLHVIGYQAPPATEPKSEQERTALAEAQGALRALVDQLAAAGGGHGLLVSLTRHQGPLDPGGEAVKGAAEKLEPPADLTKPLESKHQAALKELVGKALLRADGPAEAFLEQLGACPDARVVGLLMPALQAPAPPHAAAAVRGLAKNPEPKARAALLKELLAAKDPALQRVLLRAYGPGNGPDVTEGLSQAAEALPADARRLAWRLLADRPQAELQAIQPRLARLAKDLPGLAGFHATQALARASGAAEPSRQGLETGEGKLLPERFVAGGVAFVVDTHRDLQGPLAGAAPPPPPPEKKEDEKGGDKKDEKKPEKKDEKGGAKKDEKQPEKKDELTRWKAVAHEVGRALIGLGPSEAAVQVVTTAGDALKPKAEPLGGQRGLDAAKDWVQGRPTSSDRDVNRALARALDDPAVEVIHLIVGGRPLRSPGAKDARELIEGLRPKLRARGVEVHVVLLLGKPESAAARQDELAALEAIYRPLAEESGGGWLLRETVDVPEQKKQ